MLDHAEIATYLLHDPTRAHPGRALRRALPADQRRRSTTKASRLFSRPLRRGSFEFLCRAALSAATLEEALDRIARFLRIVLDDLEVEVQRAGGAAVLVISQEQPLPVGATGRVFAFEWLLRMIHGLAAWLVAHPLPLDEVAFPYPPPLHAADYELVFAPRYTFDAPRLEARFPAD